MLQLHVMLDWIEDTVNAQKTSTEDGILFQYDEKEKSATKQVSYFLHSRQ